MPGDKWVPKMELIGKSQKLSKINKTNKQSPPPPHPKKPLTNSHNRSQNMHKKLQIKMETTHLFQHLRQKKQHIPSSTTRLWKYQQLMMCNPNVNKLLAAGALASYTPYEREQTADKNYWCDNMMEKQVKVPLVFVKLKHEALFCTLT